MTTCIPDIVTQTIDVSAGALEYLIQVKLYETSGADISTDPATTSLPPTGTPPSIWAAPALISRGVISVEDYLALYPADGPLVSPTLAPTDLLHWVSVQDLVGSGTPVGNYDWWARVQDVSETTPRLIGRVAVR